MIAFPNAKINIGLNVLNKRQDGFHDIETVLVPIRLCDFLEIIVDDDKKQGHCDLNITGLAVAGDPDENLCLKAYHLLHTVHTLPSIKIHLHKNIPIGAGMGGGSTDCAYTLKLLNNLFTIGLSDWDLQNHCRELGSDCSFFIDNSISLAIEKGAVLEPLSLDLKDYYIVIVNPSIHINTASMYNAINPDESLRGQLKQMISAPLVNWRDTIVNGFELPAFELHPKLELIKSSLYGLGADFASMTGSGSTIFGIFSDLPEIRDEFADCFVWQDKFI